MGFQTPPAPVLYVDDVLTGPPTAANPEGVYTQVAGALPPGVDNYGDLFWWDGTDAETLLEFYYAPATIEVQNQCFTKQDDGTYWAVAKFSVKDILTAVPTAATPQGFYLHTAAPLPTGVSLGDIYYWHGDHIDLRAPYANAPSVIEVAGQAYAKAPAPTYWQSLGAVYGEVVYPEGPSMMLRGGGAQPYQTVLTINIPSAGTWRIDYVVRTSITAAAGGNGTLAGLFDSAGAMVPSAAMTAGFAYGNDSIQATAAMHKIVQTSGPATYTLRAKAWVDNYSTIASDSTGQTKISYQKVG